MPTASTTISRDGRVLAVDRFDVRNSDENFGMEDFCSLLGLPPANKYETTWEKISASLTAYVPGPLLHESRRNLAALLLLTYALRNADCHSKNVALLYTSHRDVKLSPAYDMITTTVYEDWRTSPPGIKIDGRRNWLPGAYLRKSIQAHFLVSEAEQRDLITQIADAISDTLPELQFAIQQYPGFKEIGSSMVSQWTEGINSLLDKKCYNLGRRLQVANAKEGKSGKKHKRRVIGRSEAFKRRPSDTN
jgi:serine/threonine-protein kinase HipA